MSTPDPRTEAVEANRAEWWAEPEVHETEVQRIGSWGECRVTCTCGWMADAMGREQGGLVAEAHIQDTNGATA